MDVRAAYWNGTRERPSTDAGHARRQPRSDRVAAAASPMIACSASATTTERSGRRRRREQDRQLLGGEEQAVPSWSVRWIGCRSRAEGRRMRSPPRHRGPLMPCEVTSRGCAPRRSSRRKMRSATFRTIGTCTHEWSELLSRSAFVCWTSHHASAGRPRSRRRAATELLLPACGRSHTHGGDCLSRRDRCGIGHGRHATGAVSRRSGPRAGCRPRAGRPRGACTCAPRRLGSASTSSSRDEPKWQAILSSEVSAAS